MDGNYWKPEDVVSPQTSLDLDHVIYDGGENELAVARGKWNQGDCLLMRWNGSKDNKTGNPQSSGYATWLVVPQWMETEILSAVSKRIDQRLKERRL